MTNNELEHRFLSIRGYLPDFALAWVDEIEAEVRRLKAEVLHHSGDCGKNCIVCAEIQAQAIAVAKMPRAEYLDYLAKNNPALLSILLGSKEDR